MVSEVDDLNLCISDEEIGRVQEFKYVGLWLDESLTFDYHISKVYILFNLSGIVHY